MRKSRPGYQPAPPPSNPDTARAAAMLLALAATDETRTIDTLALVCKVVIEGKLPLFRAVVRKGEADHAPK